MKRLPGLTWLLMGRRMDPGLLPVLASLLVFLFSLFFLEQAPLLLSVQPPAGRPGDRVVLHGRDFSRPEDGAWIRFDQELLQSEAIISWTMERIEFNAPSFDATVAVQVGTPQGQSQPLVFSHVDQVPRLLGSAAGQETGPLIRALEIPVVQPGMVAEIQGKGFGRLSYLSRILVGNQELDMASILDWNDGRIRFLLPAWEGSTELRVRSNQASSQPWGLPPMENPVSILASARYQLAVEAELGEVEWSDPTAGGLVTVYFPRPENDTLQTLDDSQIQPAATRLLVRPASWLVFFDHPTGEAAQFRRFQYTLERRTLRRPLASQSTLVRELGTSPLLSSSPLVPLDPGAMGRWIRERVGIQGDSLDSAMKTMAALVQNIQPDPKMGMAFAPEVLGDGRASPFSYAGLGVALLRLQGIPARMVEGMVQVDRDWEHHFWISFNVAGLGWYEVDPYQVRLTWDGAGDLEAAIWSSAGLDHLALSRGEGSGSLSRTDQSTRYSMAHNTLLGVESESSGGIDSYGLFVPQVKITRKN